MAIIACPNCGKSISSESVNCIHCSSPLTTINQNQNLATPQNQQQQVDPNQYSNHSKDSFSQDITTFYKGDFKEILSTFFSNPIDGIRGIFININQNKIIKIFSVASVALLPPTLIASIYGMNFQYMPELSQTWGYPFAIVLMAGSAVVPMWYFRKRGWLK